MPQFRVAFVATSNTSGGVEDTWIEIFPPSGVSIAVKRVLLTSADTTLSDGYVLSRWGRFSTAGSGGTAATIIKLRPDSPNSVCTVNVKNGTTAFTLGTNIEYVTVQSHNARGIWEYVARDGDDFVSSGTNERLSWIMRTQAASHDMGIQMDWEE